MQIYLVISQSLINLSAHIVHIFAFHWVLQCALMNGSEQIMNERISALNKNTSRRTYEHKCRRARFYRFRFISISWIILCRAYVRWRYTWDSKLNSRMKCVCTPPRHTMCCGNAFHNFSGALSKGLIDRRRKPQQLQSVWVPNSISTYISGANLLVSQRSYF